MFCIVPTRVLAVAVMWLSQLASAQTVRVIDLTGVTQRTTLRFPPAPAPKCDASGICGSGGSVGVSVGDGAEDPRDKHASRASLLWLETTQIHAKQPIVIDVNVENAGELPVSIPVFAHLADLQPAAAESAFEYESMELSLMAGIASQTLCLGSITLYGSGSMPDTIVTLKPGESIRIRGKIEVRQWYPKATSTDGYATFLLRKEIFHPRPGGYGTAITNLYPRNLKGSTLPLHVYPEEFGESPDKNGEYLLDDSVSGIALYSGRGYRSYVQERDTVPSLNELERRLRLLPKVAHLYWKPYRRDASGQPILLFEGQLANFREFCRTRGIDLIIVE